jgi:hypothetical protein
MESRFDPIGRMEDGSMMAMKHEITQDDILPMERYASERKERRARLVGVKKHRRVEVGPDCTFYFENYETMWHQVHEMLFIEKGGEAQIPDELAAYNPLIPKGRELVATVMFEIDDPARRQALLAKLGGVEETAFLQFGGETVIGRPEEDVDRTSSAGKARGAGRRLQGPEHPGRARLPPPELRSHGGPARSDPRRPRRRPRIDPQPDTRPFRGCRPGRAGLFSSIVLYEHMFK